MESVGMQIRRHARSNKDYKSRDKVDSAYNFFESINELVEFLSSFGNASFRAVCRDFSKIVEMRNINI